MITSSFTGHENYMRALPDLMGDAEAMKNFGNSVVVWDFHARKPLQTLEIPGAPLEVRWALGPRHDYAFIEAALTGELWGVFRKEDGTFEAEKVADIGTREEQPLLAVDISISSDDKFLFVDTFMDGKVRVYDIENPHAPKVNEEVRRRSTRYHHTRRYRVAGPRRDDRRRARSGRGARRRSTRTNPAQALKSRG